MTNLFGQHQLRVRRHPHEHLVELQGAGGPRPDHSALAQQVDEVFEQRAIEELRGIEAIQHVHALGSELTLLLERLLIDGAAARPDPCA